MPNPLIGVAAVSAAGSIFSAVTKSSAIGRAEEAQTTASREAIAATERAQLRLTEILRPFTEVATGTPGEGGATGSIQATQALIGLLEDEEQANAISSIESGAEFQSLTRQGEEAILANASATGGLRGGDVQGALGQFRPALLQNLIGQRLNRLGTLTQVGQASAAQTGAGNLQTGQNLSNIFQTRGTNAANAALARGQNLSGLFGDLSGIAGSVIGGF